MKVQALFKITPTPPTKKKILFLHILGWLRQYKAPIFMILVLIQTNATSKRSQMKAVCWLCYLIVQTSVWWHCCRSRTSLPSRTNGLDVSATSTSQTRRPMQLALVTRSYITSPKTQTQNRFFFWHIKKDIYGTWTTKQHSVIQRSTFVLFFCPHRSLAGFL